MHVKFVKGLRPRRVPSNRALFSSLTSRSEQHERKCRRSIDDQSCILIHGSDRRLKRNAKRRTRAGSGAWRRRKTGRLRRWKWHGYREIPVEPLGPFPFFHRPGRADVCRTDLLSSPSGGGGRAILNDHVDGDEPSRSGRWLGAQTKRVGRRPPPAPRLAGYTSIPGRPRTGFRYARYTRRIPLNSRRRCRQCKFQIKGKGLANTNKIIRRYRRTVKLRTAKTTRSLFARWWCAATPETFRPYLISGRNVASYFEIKLRDD